MNDWMLTDEDLKTATGVELLDIATRITSDNQLDIGEVNELRRWLKRNATGTAINAVKKLAELMARIAADGVVDRDELIQLQMAVERVIPPLSLPPAKPKAKKATKKKAPKKQAAPRIRHLFSKVAGVTFENKDGSDRQQIVSMCKPREYLSLVHEPSNRYSDVATQVLRLSGEQLGYLPEHLAEDVCEMRESGLDVAAYVTQITGGSSDRPTRGANIAVFIAEPECKPEDVSQYIKNVMDNL